MRRVLPIAAALLNLIMNCETRAGDVLDRVRREGLVRCAAAEQPVVAIRRPDGGIDGLAVYLCGAVAIAVLGREGRIAFTPEDEAGDADVAFVAAASVPAHDRLVTGPVIYNNDLSVLVPRTSHVHALRDLADETVCLMIGSPEQRAVEQMVHRLGVDIVRLPFEEDVEMRDAYTVGRCGAVAGARSELQGWRKATGVNRLTSRLLPEPLAVDPVAVATPTTDHAWARIVFWLVNVLVRGDAGVPPWRGPGAKSAVPAGVRRGWREDVRTLRRG